MVPMNRIIFITDIHSSYTKFINLLEENNYDDKNDILVLGGDYFDRGKESRLMAQWLIDNYKKPNVHLIRGNHDDFMMDLLEGRNEFYKFNYERNGLKNTVKDFIKPNYFYDPYRVASMIRHKFPLLTDVMKSLKNYVEIDGNIFTHGGLPVNFRNNTNENDWLNARWGRSLDWAKSNPFPEEKAIYIGHWTIYHMKIPQDIFKYKLQKINNITFCDGGLSYWDSDGLALVIDL